MRRIAIVGAGVSGLGAAWALHHHPDRFDFRVYEARDSIGGNAVTVDMPQDDGGAVPFDISVTACIPSVYRHVLLLMREFGVDLVETRFSYSVQYGPDVYAHDLDSALRRELAPEIERFQRLLRMLHRVGWLTRAQSQFLNAANPFNYVSMGRLLKLAGFSDAFLYKVLKPMFVNFLMATDVYSMPAALFARYLDFFDVESATPMWTWDGGTRRIYDRLTAGFRDKILLNRPVRRVYRRTGHVVVEDENGARESYDDVVFACNANHTLAILDRPTALERFVLGSVRYDASLHREAVVHSDASVLPDNAAAPLATRSNHLAHYGDKPDNYEITYIMHNQQPWAHGSDKPCLVTYNAASPIDESKVLLRRRFQHVVHDVRHVALLVSLFRFIQGKRRTWHCGAHTLVNSQETCLVTGLAAARQLGAGYHFADPAARRTFNYYGGILYGPRFRKARRRP